MNVAKKFAAYALLVVLAVVVAGIYGMAHDQISYTVSSEYFTRFKFRQFNLDDTPLPNRVRAAIVGFLATWCTFKRPTSTWPTTAAGSFPTG